jgi:hypothetical protein
VADAGVVMVELGVAGYEEHGVTLRPDPGATDRDVRTGHGRGCDRRSGSRRRYAINAMRDPSCPGWLCSATTAPCPTASP